MSELTKIVQGTEGAIAAVWHEILKVDHTATTVVEPILQKAGADAASIEQVALVLGGAKAEQVATVIFGANGIVARVLAGIADADAAVTDLAKGTTAQKIAVDFTDLVAEIKALV